MTMGLPSNDCGHLSMTTCRTSPRGPGRYLMAVVAIALGTQTCLAATTTTTFNVSLTITSNCTVSATAMAFGTSGIIAANIDASSTVTVTCTNTTPYSVGLDAGTGSGATVTTRKMTSGGATVDYSLYQDNGRSTIWGNTVGTNTVGGTGNGSGQALTVYGRVPSQSTPAPGAYSDTITVTVTY
jgi:spore coat protein U-like protein